MKVNEDNFSSILNKRKHQTLILEIREIYEVILSMTALASGNFSTIWNRGDALAENSSVTEQSKEAENKTPSW